MTFDLFVNWIFACCRKKRSWVFVKWISIVSNSLISQNTGYAGFFFFFLPLAIIQEDKYFNRLHMTYSCKSMELQNTEKSLNLFISISLPHSCNGSGPWWFLVAQIQVMRLESSMTQEVGIETSLPCFSFWVVLGFFMFLSLS